MSGSGTNIPSQSGDLNYISPLRFWVQKVLPLTFDDSLSYYELLSKVVYKLNEVIEIVNPLGAGIEDTINAYLDKFTQQWEAELQAFQTTVNTNIDQNNAIINGRIDALTTSVDTQIANNKKDTDQHISDLQTKVLTQVATLAATISTTDEANRVWTLAQIQDLKTQLTQNYPPVIDPTDGQLESVQTALNHMWDAWRGNALTASEYDALDLTAQEYDDKQLTAKAYDDFGKTLLDPDVTTISLSGVPIPKNDMTMEAIRNGKY